MESYTVYHGTSYGDAAKRLLQAGPSAIDFRRRKTKNPGSLGYGFYTFLNDGELAAMFARKFSGSNSGVLVLQLDVVLEPEHTLAFDTSPEDRQKYQEWLQSPDISQQVARLQKVYKNSFRQQSLDGALLEAYCQELKGTGSTDEIYAIRSTTHTDVGTEVPGSTIPNGVEVLIKNRAVILNKQFQIYHSASDEKAKQREKGDDSNGKVHQKF